MKNMKLKINKKKLIILIISILFVLLLTYFIGKPIISMASNEALFKAKIESFGILGNIFFVFIVALQVIFALIPSEALEISAGYIYGTVFGSLICLIGIVLGSSLTLIFVKKFGRKFVNLFYSDEKIDSIKFLNDEKKLAGLVFIIFLIPGTPKDLLTYLIGLTKMKIRSYILLTTLARFPSIIISNAAGSALASNSINQALMYFLISLSTGVIGFIVYELVINKKSKHS